MKTIRVKVVYDRSKRIKAINSETGEGIEGLCGVDVKFIPKERAKLVLTFDDFDIDMTTDAIINIDGN